MSIYEVTQMLQDKNNIQNDMQQAMELVRDMFYKKYLQKIEKEVEIRREKIKANRPKEVELLYAVKPFLAQDKSAVIDKMADSIMMMQTLNTLQSEMNRDYRKESVHSDGIYDVDENCMASKNNNFVNAMLIFAMCSAIN
jgi:hypothetical protein